MNPTVPVPGGTSESCERRRPRRGQHYGFLAGLGCLLLAGALAQGAGARDVIGVYEGAVKNDPQIRAADANRLASRESRPQALAALLPQISGTAAYTRDHNGGNEDQIDVTPPPNQVPYAAPLPFTAGTGEKQWGLNLRQNLFSWGNWETLKASNSQVAQAEATYAAAEQNLIFRVAQAYFNVLSAQDNLEAQQASLQAIAHQLDQADKRYDVGLIAITDVQEAKASRDTASAAVIAAKRTLATSEDQLQEITGEKYDALSKPGADMPLNMPEPADEERWVNISLDQNLTLT